MGRFTAALRVVFGAPFSATKAEQFWAVLDGGALPKTHDDEKRLREGSRAR